MLSYGRLYWHFGCKSYKDEGLIKKSVQFKIHRIPHNLCAYWALIHQSLHNLCELIILYYIILSTSTYNYTYHRHWQPPHSVSCPQYLHQWLDEKPPPVQVAEGDTTVCASGLSALVAEWKSTTSTSCNWWQPPPVQVECCTSWKKGTPQAQGPKVRM